MSLDRTGKMASIEFVSPLSMSECLERLRAAAAVSERQPITSWPSINDPMLVRVSGTRLRLMKASGGPPRNSFRRMFHGEVVEHPSGALIRGRFALHFLVRAFLCVWFGVVTYAAVRVLFTAGERSVVAFPILLGLVGVAIVRSGISLSRRGEREVLHYLRELLEVPRRVLENAPSK